MVSISAARSLLHPLLGQPIWGVRRSHGSFFLAEFGAIKEVLSLPSRRLESGRTVPERQALRGTWTLMVELCRWRIEVGGKSTSDFDEDHPHVQDVMSALDGASILSIEIEADALTLRFSNDGRMRLGPANDVARGDTGSQWVVFLPDGTNLSRDTDARLRLEHKLEQAGP